MKSLVSMVYQEIIFQKSYTNYLP